MLELLTNIKRRKFNDLGSIYKNYGKKLYGYAVTKWNLTEDEAWEVIYKTLYKVDEVKDQYTFENENKFVGFLFKTFINYLRNYYRDHKNKNIETIELTDKYERVIATKDEVANEEMQQSNEMACLQQELIKLEDWQRILLLMRAQNFTYEEIAKYVNKPVHQLKVYHMRLKKQLTESVTESLNNIKDGNK